MNISNLLVAQPGELLNSSSPSKTTTTTKTVESDQRCHNNNKHHPVSTPSSSSSTTVCSNELMSIWNNNLARCGFQLRPSGSSNKLTDAILDDLSYSNKNTNSHIKQTPIHIKVIGRHMNGSFRCHIGMGKASRPIRTMELDQHMRLLAVFFRPEKSKNNRVSPTFILFPSWLLHLFRYTQHNGTPGRTDVRFLENEKLAKEDHIYRLNYVINTLFRFNLHSIDVNKLRAAIELTNFLFDIAGLDQTCLPRPDSRRQPQLYSLLMNLLNSPRPPKSKPVCHNCNTKPASRRKLCVACYRYQLKHGISRPLRLIIASRHHCRIAPTSSPQQSTPTTTTTTTASSTHSSFFPSSSSPIGSTTETNHAAMTTMLCQQQQQQQQQDIYNHYTHSYPYKRWYTSYQHQPNSSNTMSTPPITTPPPPPKKVHKSCANCGIQHTHQWYRNLCGAGHWCETCKSYYLRHGRVRPPQLFVKAAKRKVNVRALVNWSPVTLSPTPSSSSSTTTLIKEEEPLSLLNPFLSSPELISSPISSPVSSNGQRTPVQPHLSYTNMTPTTTQVATSTLTSSNKEVQHNSSSSSSNNIFVYYHRQ
ncbi:hypothetical protein INT45_014131 [Circinella minor]|uniref:GATA-type domain-containing protein n=1 Tax=Circinella minor TaxID=1195481 RepID=A0A8H7RWC5_9FUNG|nr:hypothetical protein INT45_014131 [Circinella minor]